jgi:hypothetical protein
MPQGTQSVTTPAKAVIESSFTVTSHIAWE